MYGSHATVRGVSDRVVGFVPLRAGSKGLPGKNTRVLAGRPLYQHSIDVGLAAGLEGVWISTDIEEVLTQPPEPRVVRRRRPSELAGDDVSMAGVLGDFVDHVEGEPTVVLLQATSPLRRSDQLRQAIDRFRGAEADVLMSVCPAPADVLKWGTVRDGWFEAMRSPEHAFMNRQQLPKVVRPNGAIYIFEAAWFRSQSFTRVRRNEFWPSRWIRRRRSTSTRSRISSSLNRS